MPGPWDSAGKLLLRLLPQHIVSWLLKGAIYVRTLSPELKSRSIFADGLFEIIEDGRPALMHIEFQSRNHSKMPERLLEYSVQAASENDWLSVHSFVIYLRNDGPVQRSPLVLRYNSGQEYHHFHYTVIELAKLPARAILRTGLLGVYPLIPLSDGGTGPGVVQEMITTLTEERQVELLALAYTFGGLAPGREAYESWFRRSFAMLDDILEESWTYQELVQKGLQQGLQQTVEEQHHAVTSVVERLFPELASFAKPRIEAISDIGVLHDLLDDVLVARTAEQAKQAIMQARVEE